MSNALSTIDTSSALLNFIRSSTHLSSEPLNLVTVTSIETETIYPTLVYTISGSGPDSSTTTTVLDFLSLTLNPTPVTVTLTTTKLSTTKQDTTISTSSSTATVIPDPPVSTLVPTTSVLSSPMGEFPISASSESTDLWYSDAPSSTWIPPVPLTSSIIFLPSTLSVLSKTAIGSTSSSTPASSSTAPSNTPSILPFIGTATSAASSETAQADHSSPSKTGTIVGSIIGGSAITIFALLAYALYMRRRRRKIATERLGIRQKLIRGDSTSSSISHHNHHRYHSYPSIPDNIGPRSPTLPVIPLQQQPSNPDLSLDSMYLRGKRRTQDPFVDLPSAVIQISAPSRSVSIYSTSSRGAGRGGQGYWDCERDGADTLVVPHGYLDTPMIRDSMRSDPFDLDLEPPPNAHHRRSSLPSIPTTWGVKF
ncbi:hypothetical protein N7463_005917 [Penicillium fimorum]|uniref:Uncharacterized protein n=1 Tax=Penicillium fimorum TaxID=1882269 RepID=A0A9X0C5K2_9EURO|nr:hypothetical protein N7463_005917 [Penicillium fimorum]